MLGAAGCASPSQEPRTPQQIEALREASQTGDSHAAWQLYRYYEYNAHESDKAAYYLKRSGALGNPKAKAELDYRAEYQKRGSF